jgi:hypothetical protein
LPVGNKGIFKRYMWPEVYSYTRRLYNLSNIIVLAIKNMNIKIIKEGRRSINATPIRPGNTGSPARSPAGHQTIAKLLIAI